MSDPLPTPRRPYAKPRLISHGRLVEVTRVIGGNQGRNDMAKKGNKTGF